ncbi:MAG TPA: S9 family peptidase [Acidimicrobiia bacterium]|nr:S9 family peptidase [Acidimicrobiia bacterium]
MGSPTPPTAPRRPHVLSIHGDERVDDWYWMRDRDDPAVIAHLEAENAYAEALLAPAASLRDRIFNEIRGRIQETDSSAPMHDGEWTYYTRTVEGEQYAIHCRMRRAGGPEQVTLDENELAAGHDYFALGGFETSPDQRLLAYSTDETGGERYTLRFRDLESGHDLPDVVENVTYGLAWSDDARTCFYVRPDDAMRPHEVWRHRLGTAPAGDALVFREDDERFFLGIGRTRSGRFVLIDAESKLTSETWFIPSAEPEQSPTVIAPREHEHEYSVEHHVHPELGDRFLIVTNSEGARNFRVVAAPVTDPSRANWVELVAHRDDVRIDSVDAFRDHLAISERSDGLDRVRVMRFGNGAWETLPATDPVFSMWVGPNLEFESSALRCGYTSLVAPVTDFDYEPASGTSTVVKVQPVLGGYDPSAYTSARLWATAADGTKIPISVVHRRDVALDGRAPALLAGYGAYEHSTDPVFRAARLSLLDRGFVFAIAHVRGGGELGREWYEQGRLEHKHNTFTDFVACAEALVSSNYTAPGRMVARGGSAGGLLMGAVANLRPDLFAAIVAEVPFVDVVTTMLDPELPLTVTEWEEWGDPRDPAAYARMKSYSPYDNVTAQPYPALFVTTGLNDPRVQYWEPAKWVAKLRSKTTSDKPIVLRTELEAGHGGPSGRYDAWRDEATVLAFVCTSVGIEA